MRLTINPKRIAILVIVRRLLFSWFIWFMLEAMLFSVVVAFSLAHAHPFPSPYTILSGAQPSTDPDDGVSEQTSSIFTAFNLECTFQSKKTLVLPRTVSIFSKERERDRSIRPVPVLIFFPSAVFFPRKLSSSAEEDPFIS